MRHYPGPGFNGSSMLFGFIGFILTIVLLALITLLVVYLVKRSKGQTAGPTGFGQPHHGSHQPMPPALQVLDERLARGEIEVEDYLTRKAALLGNPGQAANEWTPQQSPTHAVPPEEPTGDQDA